MLKILFCNNTSESLFQVVVAGTLMRASKSFGEEVQVVVAGTLMRASMRASKSFGANID